MGWMNGGLWGWIGSCTPLALWGDTQPLIQVTELSPGCDRSWHSASGISVSHPSGILPQGSTVPGSSRALPGQGEVWQLLGVFSLEKKNHFCTAGHLWGQSHSRDVSAGDSSTSTCLGTRGTPGGRWRAQSWALNRGQSFVPGAAWQIPLPQCPGWGSQPWSLSPTRCDPVPLLQDLPHWSEDLLHFSPFSPSAPSLQEQFLPGLAPGCSHSPVLQLGPSASAFPFQIPPQPPQERFPLPCPYLQGERREKSSPASGKISHVGLSFFRKLSNAIYQLITGLHRCPLIPPAVCAFWKGP